MTADALSRWATAAEISSAVRSGAISAQAVTEAALERIHRHNPAINAFTDVTADRARKEARAIDTRRASGEDPGPLAGVPYAVKNLFDVRGLVTRAGALINRDRPPAGADAELLRRMRDAGAVLVGALNMGEYAYDFTGRNAHDGDCRNPHDPSRMPGGSSSGSGAATAAGLAPVSLGSDTNGSLRVPASLCGVFSLKPTYGRVPRTGTFAFVDSLDHLGPFARSAADLALTYEVLKGPDKRDHACIDAPDNRTRREGGLSGLRVGLPTGWLAEHMGAAASHALTAVADSLEDRGAEIRPVALGGAEAGRSAAFLITNVESATLHLDRLRTRPLDFDPDTRDRFIAGALLPATWLARAQRARAVWLQQALDLFRTTDVLLVPATPVPAPGLDERVISIGGRTLPLRPNLGLLSQPFSAIGLPVVTVPVFSPGELPIGLQIVTRPWAERLALDVAKSLEAAGTCIAHPPPGG